MPSLGRVAIQFNQGDPSDAPVGQWTVPVNNPEAAAFVAKDESGKSEESVNEAAKSAGWWTTGKYYDDHDQKYEFAGGGAEGTGWIPRGAWQEAREIRFGVDRDYGGINSSGGPQQSGRADHRLISLTRNSDLISPQLFKRCCNGLQLRRVVVFLQDMGFILVAEACHVVSFEFIGDKYRSASWSVDSISNNAGFTAGASDDYQANNIVGVRAFERVQILYTNAALGARKSDGTYYWQGWNTGNEIHWDTPLNTP